MLVIFTGVGSALPVERTVRLDVPVSSVTGGLFGSDADTNSCTVPVRLNELPTTAAAGTLDPVKTNTPSEVELSPSPSGSCKKKPFDITPVTVPEVVIC